MPPCAPRVIESFRHAHSHVTEQVRVPIEVWTLELEHEALAKLLNVSQLPIVQHHVLPCRTCMRGLVAPWLGDSLCRCQHGYRCGMNALRLCCRPLICRIIWHITPTSYQAVRIRRTGLPKKIFSNPPTGTRDYGARQNSLSLAVLWQIFLRYSSRAPIGVKNDISPDRLVRHLRIGL
jgi:hypothetical protein